MVYQEQVMQMAQIVGGYTLGGADLLRRAMGKKNVAEMAKQRAMFRDGAAKNGCQRAPGRRDLRPDGEIRRLRLQQVARRGVRAGRVPDRVAEGALPGRVHGRGAVVGHGQHRQGRRLSSTRRARSAWTCCRPTSMRRATCSMRSIRTDSARDPLRPRRGQGRRPRRVSKASSRRANAAATFRDLADFCQRVDAQKLNKRALEALDPVRRDGCAGEESRRR